MDRERDRRTGIEHQRLQASTALARFDRLRELAEDDRLPPDVRQQLYGEAWDVLDDAGSVRLSIARDMLGVPDSTLREWIDDGVIDVAAQRPARLTLADVVRARDALRGADIRARKHRLAAGLRRDVRARRQRAVSADLVAAWVRRGTVRGTPGPYGTFDVDADELDYLDSHRDLLTALDDVLCDISADLVVLFGSAARGSDTTRSDVDLLVDIPGRDGEPRRRLATELRQRLGRPVDTVALHAVEHQPWLLSSVLRDGRVVRDTRGRWPALQRAAAQIEAAAANAHDQLVADARAALEEMKSPA